MTVIPYKKFCILSSWAVFAVSLIIYWLTCERGASFWDCPEYITVASLLEVGHPPGNPLWALAMRVATMPFPPHLHAFVINLWSGIFMALAAMFVSRLSFVAILLFLRFARKKTSFLPSLLMAVTASAGAGLSFAFCDSAWFSAVEAEVYAMSAFLTGLTLWIMVRWSFCTDTATRKRLIILLAYLIGLSLGVHQLNLLCIPVFAMMALYRLYPQKLSFLKTFSVFIFSLLLVAVILFGITGPLLKLAGLAELAAVNNFSLPYNSGVIGFLVLICFCFILTFIFFPPKSVIYTISWCLFFVLLGFSTFAVIFIRGAASPPMNEGSPTDIFAFTSYINRDQYGGKPLLYGQTPFSRAILKEEYMPGDSTPTYRRYLLKKENPIFHQAQPEARLYQRSRLLTSEDSVDNNRVLEKNYGYLLSDYSYKQVKTPELDMWFPRITSGKPEDLESYEGWAGMTLNNMNEMPISEVIDSLGNFLPRPDDSGNRVYKLSRRPTYLQNIRFFLSYQLGYMYFRYLFWNFMGRQNDYPSKGEIEHGNFITGFQVIDNAMLGSQLLLSDEAGKNNKGHTVYFCIPFALGILGIFFLAFGNRKQRRLLMLIFLFFLMTGIAIVVYLNQDPGEPRERDYSFLGSFMAFSLWIGFGIFLLQHLMLKLLKKYHYVWRICAFIIAFAPATLLCIANYRGHNRSNRPDAGYFASALLDIEKPAIFFSQGDNFTFPLWYASEVLGKGTHHIVIDVSYLSSPDYMVNLKKHGLKTLARPEDIIYGAYSQVRIPNDVSNRLLPLDSALNQFYARKTGEPVFPSSRVILPGKDSLIITLKDFTGGSAFLPFRQLMLLDIIAANSTEREPRSLYFLNSVSGNFLKPLKPYLQQHPLARVYHPVAPDSLRWKDFMEEVRLMAQGKKGIPADAFLDPVIKDQYRRQRGGAIAVARSFLDNNSLSEAAEIAESIPQLWSYDKVENGTFTLSDTTFYEGVEYARILHDLFEVTEDEKWKNLYDNHHAKLKEQSEAWLKYYRHLSPTQREALSNETLRILSGY